MKRLIVVCSCVVLAGGVAGWAARLCTSLAPWQLKTRLASELNSSDPNYEMVMCGPRGLSVALGRFGINIVPEDIASRCRVTSYGVALADLQRVADNVGGVAATARKLNWEDLRAIDGVAVLFVRGNHYVAADPRESASDGNLTPGMRVYDRDVPARWYSRAELEKVWSGETLVIAKRRAPPDVPGDAHIVWDECYIDRGVLVETAVASFRFSLRNEGRQDLIIEGIQKSCGCMTHRLSTKQLAPGESAQFEVDVNLTGKEGYVQQSANVKTNDPANPVSFLRMACGVPKKRPVSSQVIRLEDLPQGGSLNQEFVVVDPCFSGIKVQGVSFHLRGGPRSMKGLSCSVSRELIGDDAPKVTQRTRFSSSRGDYLVQLSFRADPGCPVGPFDGQVVVNVEADGVVATHKVEIQGMIVQDVHSVPQMALISLGPDRQSVGSATIQLRSRGNRAIRVLKAWANTPRTLAIDLNSVSQAGQHEYVVTARMPDLDMGHPPIQGTATFELEGGSVVSVPVTVFRPPQAGEHAPPESLDTGAE